MSQAKMGFNAKAYRQTTGTRAAWPGTGAAPALTEVSNVKDLNLPIEKGEVDASSRASNGFEITAGALKKASVEFEMVWDTTDTNLAAFITAYYASTTVAMAYLDGVDTVAGTQGLWADWEVLKIEKMEPLNGIQSVKISMKPGYSAVPPAWITVA